MSLIQFEQTKIDPRFPHKAVAISTWDAKSDIQISIKKGDILIIERRQAPGWLFGGTDKLQGIISDQVVRFGQTAQVLFDFESNGNSKKLDVKAGTIVFVVNSNTPDSDWVKAFNQNKEGMLPSNYCLFQHEESSEGVVLFDFKADPNSVLPQISLQKGDLVVIEKKPKGWWIGRKQGEERRGFFPSNYVREGIKQNSEMPIHEIIEVEKTKEEKEDITATETNETSKEEVSTSVEEPIKRSRQESISGININEILTEWSNQIALKTHSEYVISSLKIVHSQLSDLNRFLSSPISKKEDLDKKIMEKIEEGKRVLSGEIILRDTQGNILTEKTVSPLTLLQRCRDIDRKDSSTSLQASISEEKQNQYLFEYVSSNAQFGEGEINFSIYSKNENKILTEDFQILFGKSSVPVDIFQENKLKTVFKDIESRDVLSDLYLVCRIIRRGKIKEIDKKQKVIEDFRRPYGCGIISLKELSLEKPTIDLTIPIFNSKDESFYCVLPEFILSKSPYIDPRPGEIKAKVKLIAGSYKNAFLKNETLSSISVTNRLTFPSESIHFDESRNDLYITLESGEFPGNNLEAVVEVRMEDGERIKDCISIGSSKPTSEFRSLVFYHTNAPKWSETIKFSIPEEQFHKAHIKFDIREVSSSKPPSVFAFTFLKLAKNDGTVVADGEQILSCYKPVEKVVKDKKIAYLQESAHLEGGTRLSQRRDMLRIRVRLTSTVVTQNISILKLTSWENRLSELSDILTSVTFIEHVEIMKFFQKIFNCLFAILNTKASGTAMEPQVILVYNGIVYILGVLLSTPQYDFRSILDIYIEKQFVSKATHKPLMSCMSHYFLGQGLEGNTAPINATVKSLEYLFKFIKASLLKNENKSIAETDKKEISECILGLSELMKKKSPTLIVSQILALKNFSTLLKSLNNFFTIQELVEISMNFINAVQVDEKSQKINSEKLLLLKYLVEEGILNQETKKVLTPFIVKNLKLQFEFGTETKETFSVLKSLLNSLVSLDLFEHLFELTPVLLTTEFKREDKVDFLTSLLTIFHLAPETQFLTYFETLGDAKRGYIVSLIRILEIVFTENIFPAKWTTMRNFHLRITSRLFKMLGPRLKTVGTDEDTADVEMWTAIFNMLFNLIFEKNQEGQEGVQIEFLTIFENLWKDLEPYHLSFVNLVAKFITLICVPANETLKAAGTNLFFQMIVVESSKTNSLMRCEGITIDTLDRLAMQKKVDENLIDKVFCELLERKVPNDTEVCSKLRLNFLISMSQLVSKLFAMQSISDKPEFEQERVMATHKIMVYYKRSNRKDVYLKYVHMLCNIQEQAKNVIEAGYTLLLHAEMYGWNDEKLKPFSVFTLQFPEQSQRQRKEKLYQLAIQCFDKGQYWEKGIELLRELKEQCQNFTYNFKDYIGLLEQESSFFDKMVKTERLYNEYFRVGFYGKDFPPSIQGKEFIYRGDVMEKMSDFAAKMFAQYPYAEFLKTTEPSPEIANGEKQYLLITTVLPSSEEEMNNLPKDKPKPKTSANIKKYQQRNRVNVFSYSKQVHKGKKLKDNEFSDLWLHITYLETESSFPTMYKRSDVVKRVVLELNPIQNAIQSIQQKTQDLEEIIEATNENADPEITNISSLSTNLNGILEAAANGGTSKYGEAFLSKEAEDDYSLEQKEKLKALLRKQLEVVGNGLRIHSKLCKTGMKGFQERLEDFFAKMKARVLEF